MIKVKRTNRLKSQRRTSLEIEEEQSRTLYIRIPHTIKNVDEINNLFFGDFKVKLPRKSSRFCHVIFPNIEEKVKNLKAIKSKLIDGKPIYAGPPKPMNLEKKKKPKQKKIKIPEPKDEPKMGKYLFVTNIPPGVKASEVKDAFSGSVTVALLKGLVNGKRTAKVKMSSPQFCLYYIKDRSNWPVLKEQKVSVSLAKKSKNNNTVKKQKESKSLKIYDEESELKNKSEVNDSNTKDTGTTASDEEDSGEEEEEDEEAEEEESSEEE